MKFFDDDNKRLFTMHIEEFPADWRHLITSFRHKVSVTLDIHLIIIFYTFVVKGLLGICVDVCLHLES